MNDAVDLYLNIFKEISALYEDKNIEELNISEKISQMVKNLKKTHDIETVERILICVMSVFENYYSDDYNTVGINLSKISEQEKKILNGTLEGEFFSDEFNAAFKKLSKEDRELIIDILKKEISD